MSPDELHAVAQIMREQTVPPHAAQRIPDYYTSEAIYALSRAIDTLADRRVE